MTSDNFSNFLTHLMTFHDLVMTLRTFGDNILTILKTISEDTLTALVTCGEDSLTTPVATCDHFVTTPNDITDEPCDNIDNQEQLAGSNTYQGSSWGAYQVTIRMSE